MASLIERRQDEYGQLHASGLHVQGRIVLNLWRLLRSELKLRIYTFEACVAAVLQASPGPRQTSYPNQNPTSTQQS